VSLGCALYVAHGVAAAAATAVVATIVAAAAHLMRRGGHAARSIHRWQHRANNQHMSAGSAPAH